MPDVFSIRHTTVEDYAEPVVHEIKVRRADLLADLRRADKGAAYLALASQCWYVLKRGIAEADEVPPAFGVMLADGAGLEVARPAPRRAARRAFRMAIAPVMLLSFSIFSASMRRISRPEERRMSEPRALNFSCR